MTSKKIILISLVIAMLTTTACANRIYKKGVDYDEYPDRDLLLYDDAIVFEYEEDDEEVEITFGSKDDVDEVMDFYQDFFEDEGIVLTYEQVDKDEYKAEGQIEDFLFEIEVEEPWGDSEKFYKSITTIEIEYVDSEKMQISNQDEATVEKVTSIGVTADEIMDVMISLVQNNEQFSHLDRVLQSPVYDVTGTGNQAIEYWLIDEGSVDGNVLLVLMESLEDDYLIQASVSYIFFGDVPDIQDEISDYIKLLATSYVMAMEDIDVYTPGVVLLVDEFNLNKTYLNGEVILTVPTVDVMGAYSIKLKPKE